VQYPSAGRTVVQDGLTLICLTGVDEDHDPCNTHASWRLGHALSFCCIGGVILLQGVWFIQRGIQTTPRSGPLLRVILSDAYER
jgi:hypothetical protein